MKTNSKTRDWTLVIYLAICGLSALALSPLLQPKYHGNNEAMSALVTIFTVLAGFMIAVITIAADGGHLRHRDWKQDTFYLSQIRKQLTRHRLMFHLYLVVPALAFLAHLRLDWSPGTQVALERILLFLAVFALLWSFRLPGEITQAHVRRLKQAIKDQRDQEQRALLQKSDSEG